MEAGGAMEEGVMERGSTPLGSRHDRPAPVGVTVKTRIERGDRAPAVVPYNLHITVLETVRGKAAWERVQGEGVSEGPPKSGFDYLLARIRFGYSCAARGRSEHPRYLLDKRQLVASSADGTIEYEIPPLARQPEPPLINVPFSEGDVKEGWVVLRVPEREKEPLLVFHREYDNRYSIQGPVWLKLYQFDPMCIDGTCGECR
jgi:hypothetical protein